jgi:hypothetical protein
VSKPFSGGILEQRRRYKIDPSSKVLTPGSPGSKPGVVLGILSSSACDMESVID